MELRVIVGPSGSGKRTRLAILQDLFGFMSVTGVRPNHLTKLVRKMRELEGKHLRLAVEIPTIPFSAEDVQSQSHTFVSDCIRSFEDLKHSFADSDLMIIFKYCAQQELAKRITLGFHPLMHTLGNIQGAIFTECTIQVQLFSQLCAAYDSQVFSSHEIVFSDRTGKSAEQLKDEISQRRYLKHPEEPDETPVTHYRSPSRTSASRREVVKQTIADIQKTLQQVAGESSKRSGRDVVPLQFVTRGWNTMQATILDIEKAKQLVQSDASTRVNCLLVGESGTGKEAIAVYLHHCRQTEPRGSLVTIDCTAVPENLLESELFGSHPGAFTGATKRAGLLQDARNGTVFLDEIGLMPISLQAKLLRFVETRTYRSLGSNETVEVPNCRVIAATSRNLDAAVQNGTFLVDLYNRLRAVTITVPPLRERREDILSLLKAYAPGVEFKPGAQALLFDYQWEGNVRELRSVAERYNVSTASRFRDSDRRERVPPVGVSTLLEDWPQSVARGYLEGAVKWRWPMREQAQESRKRIYLEVKRELAAAGRLDEESSMTSAREVSESDKTEAMSEGPNASESHDSTRDGAPIGQFTCEEIALYRTILKARIKNGLFTDSDEEDLWRKAIEEVHFESGGNDKHAAEQMHLNRTTYRALRIKYGLSSAESDEDQHAPKD